MPRRKLVIPSLLLLTLAVVIAGLLLFRRPADRPAPGAIATSPGAVRPPPDEAPASAPRALIPTRITARTHRPGARTAVPRLLPATTGRGGPEAPPPAGGPARLSTTGGALTDRRDQPGAGAEAVRAEISRRLQLADQAANECLKSWAGIDPTLGQGVRMTITLDRDGLDQVFLEDRAEVPAGPLACLSEAVYQQDWSGLTDTPLQVTRTLRAEQAAQPPPAPARL